MTNRYADAISVFLSSPMNSFSFVISSLFHLGGKFRLNFNGLRLLVRPNSPDIRVVRACISGEFERALELSDDKNRFIVDAGGYIGISSIVFALKFPDSLIICLEPSLKNYELARDNCAAWPSIIVLNCALAPSTGKKMLKDRGTGQWGFTIVDEPADSAATLDVAVVNTVSMDDLLKRYKKNGVDLFKLDIEGGEYALLSERPEWVRRCRVIVAEIHDRICPGATEVFNSAMSGRREVLNAGEKRISILESVE